MLYLGSLMIALAIEESGTGYRARQTTVYKPLNNVTRSAQADSSAVPTGNYYIYLI